MSTTREVILWIIGALALLLLAGPAPNIATMILVIIIAGLVLYHWSDTYRAYLTGAAGSVGPGIAASKGGNSGA